MNITRKIQMPSDYDFQQLLRRMREVDSAPLSERKENAAELYRDMHDPSLIAERIDWLLDGSYGQAEQWKALQVLERPRMNRTANLSLMIAALEWSVPTRMAIDTFKKLKPHEQENVSKAIADVISDHEDKWRAEGYSGKIDYRYPKGVKAIYDNGGKTLDRYTVYFNEPYKDPRGSGKTFYPAIAMSENPFSPQGVGQHTEGMLGSHNGKKIIMEQLPSVCQQLVDRERKDYT